MYEHDDRSSTDYQAEQADGGLRPSTGPLFAALRHNGTQFGWRHVKRVAVIRWLVAAWLVILASIFCVSGQWWGALLFLAAGLNGWLAYQMPRWKRALDAEEVGLPACKTLVRW